jgi:hypothetical protein
MPWPAYNSDVPLYTSDVFSEPTPAAIFDAQRVHPAWDLCSDQVRKLHARNSHIVRGRHLITPVAFVVCWTADGATTTATRDTGGTGQAIRLASADRIRVYNMARPDHRRRLERIASAPLPH